MAYDGNLSDAPGGTQACTREYLAVIRTAGFKVQICPMAVDRSVWTRLSARLLPRGHARPSAAAVDRAKQLVATVSPSFIFLNEVSLAAIAPVLRSVAPPECKIVVLSHGLDSTDLLHTIRLNGSLPLNARIGFSPATTLGRVILSECDFRTQVDVVCALSEFDVTLERWIGAKKVDWMPRVVQPDPIPWRPSNDRLGFVGTLDHAPNLEGLVLVLDELKRINAERVRIRVVGGPRRVGRWLSSEYGMVDYLGPLDDAGLRSEAESWNGFLHPIFCSPRGCSTKLATAIAWQIPVVTTHIGHRGYLWSAGSLTIAEDASRFARECLRLLSPEAAASAQKGVAEVAQSSPTLDQVAIRFRKLVGFNPSHSEIEVAIL